MIRPYRESDFEAVKKMHAASGLPPTCMPNLASELMIVKICTEEAGKVVQFGGVRLTGEAFTLVDHGFETPEKRYFLLEQLIAQGLRRSAEYGIEDVSAWLPPVVEKSFGSRLIEMGWIKSPWANYTAILK